MSKLPKAPLIEVIFELRWQIRNNDDLAKFQYFHGDLYSSFKNQYPVRESLLNPTLPIELLVNKPFHRFWSEGKRHPLIQVGPGLVTLNTTDEYYFWTEYSSSIESLIKRFFDLYPINEQDLFRPCLIYVDFFEVSKGQKLLTFINENLNTTFKQDFINAETDLETFNLAFSFKNSLGSVSIAINTSTANGKEGLVTETRLNGLEYKSDPSEIVDWLHKAHEFCSILFQEMTKGSLYESFKNTTDATIGPSY